MEKLWAAFVQVPSMFEVRDRMSSARISKSTPEAANFVPHFVANYQVHSDIKTMIVNDCHAHKTREMAHSVELDMVP
jgi:nitrate reductase cytochrome c-type subunit